MNKNIKDIGYILIDNIYRKTDQNKIKLFDKITKYNKIKKRSDTKKEKNAQYYLENYQNIRENNEELYNKYLEEIENLFFFTKQLGIENNQIKVINSYNKDSQFGSYDLIYVTAKSDDPTIAKTGLATINVLPPAPTISHGAQAATSKRYTATEAVNDNVSAADNTAELALLGGAQKPYTLVNLPLTVQGLGLDVRVGGKDPALGEGIA
jgi:hypothetical protein